MTEALHFFRRYRYLSYCFILILFLFDFLTREKIFIDPLYLLCFFLLIAEKKRVLIVYAAAIVLLQFYEVASFTAFNFINYDLLIDYGSVILSVVLFTFFIIRFKDANKMIDQQKEDIINGEKKFRETIDMVSEGCQIIDFDFRYRYVNNEVVNQSLFSKKEDLLGFTLMEKYPGIENTDLFHKMQQCMVSRKAIVFESEFVYPDQSSKWYQFHIEPIPEGIFLLSMDITTSKLADIKRKNYVADIEKMLDMTSHEVRHPVANILGLTDMFENHPETPALNKNKIIGYLRTSAVKLDLYAKKLTDFMQASKLKNEQ